MHTGLKSLRIGLDAWRKDTTKNGGTVSVKLKSIIHSAMIRRRYRRIVAFFARLLLSFAFWDLFLPRVGLRRWSHRTRPERLSQSARAFRGLAVQLGGVMIKVGQFLSARVDVLPIEITEELAGLQDEVPPEAFSDIRHVVESEFGVPLAERYAHFEEQPLAAASLGQVHRARLHPETLSEPLADSSSPVDQLFDVVVKVQRPNIENIIATDLAALRTVGNWLQRYRPISRRADVPALLAEFTRVLYEEIDYLAEGRNAEIFAANFKDDEGVKVPRVVWTHTTRRTLTLEDVLAIKITDYEAITAAGIDREEVATRLLDTYLRQIFEDGFFHADPHPGNLFVAPLTQITVDKPVPWQLTFVDFGMVGRVPPHTREGLRELLIGVGTQDASRVVKAYQMLGVLLPGADLELLEKMEAKAFEQFWGKNMSELTHIDTQQIRQFASEFRELIYSMPFQVPQDFIFLARCVGILSGMCTGLDPLFNVWNSLAPFAQKLVAEESRLGMDILLEEIKTYFRSLVSLPVKMDTILTKLERGDVAVRVPEVDRRVMRLERVVHQLVASIIFTGLILSGMLLYLAGSSPLWQILLMGAGLSLVWVIVTGRRGSDL
jgi:predicted unusual protein kinase regulating ubiquinone biosynthesis (AarF/ABC1/UbiB family)